MWPKGNWPCLLATIFTMSVERGMRVLKDSGSRDFAICLFRSQREFFLGQGESQKILNCYLRVGPSPELGDLDEEVAVWLGSGARHLWELAGEIPRPPVSRTLEYSDLFCSLPASTGQAVSTPRLRAKLVGLLDKMSSIPIWPKIYCILKILSSTGAPKLAAQ